MAAFFAEPRPDRPGLAVFLNAGDPPLEVLREVILLLDECRVDCLELAVPFPNSASDGPVIRALGRPGAGRRRRPRRRARLRRRGQPVAVASEDRPARRLEPLDQGPPAAGLHRPGQGRPAPTACSSTACPRACAASTTRRRRRAGQPIVTTCYATLRARRSSTRRPSTGRAYIYLVAHYGRSGTSVAPDHSALVPVLERLRARTDVPIAVGFGVKNRSHIEGLGAVGADAAIVGSACVACVEDSLATGPRRRRRLPPAARAARRDPGARRRRIRPFTHNKESTPCSFVSWTRSSASSGATASAAASWSKPTAWATR